jgi:short subunit dehydrogenase-like uncharacterized protein
MSTLNLVVYGATGYSGRLIMQRALDRGLRPIVAGRNRNEIASMAAAHGLEWTTASVDEPASLRSMTGSAAVLLNAAGPFAATSFPLIEACLATGTHYLDITGEASTIEGVAESHDEAVRRGIMLMPAVGFDVVASDCLVAHVVRRLPTAIALRLGFDKSEPTSIGSMKTILQMAGKGVLVRRQGRLIRVAPGSVSCFMDYGHGPRFSFAVNLADVSSAYFSTGIGNIEAFMPATPQVWGAVAVNQSWGWLMAAPPWQAFLETQLKWFTCNPSPQALRAGWGVLVVDAIAANGRSARSRLRTGDVYWFTALTAIGVAEKILSGEWKSGFQTPSQVYGPDFPLSFEGAWREDV